MRFLQRWARGKQWRIPFLAMIGLIAVIGSLLLYKPAFVDKGPVGLVAVDLALFFGGGFLARRSLFPQERRILVAVLPFENIGYIASSLIGR